MKLVRLVQFENAPPFILVHKLGLSNVTLVRSEQIANASVSIVITDVGIVILVRAEQLMNVF